MNEPIEQSEAPQLIPVRIVKEQGRSTLVEVEGPRRYYVPRGKIKDGQVEQSTLDKAIEYGVRWDSFLEDVHLAPDELATILRKAGIWTLDDLKRLDRKLIRIGTNIIGKAVHEAADRAEHSKLPRRK